MSATRLFLDQIASECDQLRAARQQDLAKPLKQDDPNDRRSRVRQLTLQFGLGIHRADTTPSHAESLARDARTEAAAAGLLSEVGQRLDAMLARHKEFAECQDSIEQGFTHHPEGIAVDQHKRAYMAIEDLLPAIEANREPDEPPQTTGFLSSTDLAAKHRKNPSALRKRLERWRVNHDDGYFEVQTRRKTDPTILYDETAVLAVVADCPDQTSIERPSKKKSR